MSNDLRARDRLPYNFVDGLRIRGLDIESILNSGEYGLQLATTAQVLEGTVTDKAVSPASLKAVTDQRISEAIAQSKKANGPSNYFNYQM